MASLSALARPSSGGIAIPVGTTDTLDVPHKLASPAELRLFSASGGVLVDSSVLSATGVGGNINLPNNGTARFQIESVSVSANVTAANLGTLTAGSGSNADALHTHSSLNPVITFSSGIWGSPVAGEIGYVSANNTAAKAVATSMMASLAVGAYEGVAGQLSAQKTQLVKFVSGLTLAAGDRVYVSKTAGLATNDVSAFTTGDVEFQIGTVLDQSTYAGAQTAVIVWQPGQPVQL